MTSTNPPDPAVCTPAGAAGAFSPRGSAAKPGLPLCPPVTGQPGSTSARWRWQDHAACRAVDPELFFGPDGEQHIQKAAREARAKAACDPCPVRHECLGYAVSEGLKHGVYGGMSEDERESQRRRQARARLNASRRGAAA